MFNAIYQKEMSEKKKESKELMENRAGGKEVSRSIEEMNAGPVLSQFLKQGLDKQEVQLHSLVPVTMSFFFLLLGLPH